MLIYGRKIDRCGDNGRMGRASVFAISSLLASAGMHWSPNGYLLGFCRSREIFPKTGKAALGNSA
jgi:hypothetical protein